MSTSIKKSIMPFIAKGVSSEQLLNVKRGVYSAKRQLMHQRPVLDVFLKVDDPYSYLLVQALSTFVKRFNVTLQYHVFQDIDLDMYPRLDMWHRYARLDAKALADLYDLDFPGSEARPSPEAERTLNTAMLLVQKEQHPDFLGDAIAILKQYWHGEPSDITDTADTNEKNQLQRNAELLRAKGHYAGAMIYFEGEWYWGVDRLDHLEKRLIDSGFASRANEVVTFNKTYQPFHPVSLNHEDPVPLNHSKPEDKAPLTLYWSARSPYSYIGLEKAAFLCNQYHIPLIIKPVLPMMMRDLPVPQTKKMYIFMDTKREASKLGLPYGFVADPLGEAVERCYALIAHAESQHKLTAFLLSFARAVNTEGIRADTDRGMQVIVQRCNLDWSIAKAQLQKDDWRDKVNANLEEMLSLGCWGVPCIRYGDTHFWGQDRMGLIEKMIKK